jgi:hypothetical protein
MGLTSESNRVSGRYQNTHSYQSTPWAHNVTAGGLHRYLASYLAATILGRLLQSYET